MQSFRILLSKYTPPVINIGPDETFSDYSFVSFADIKKQAYVMNIHKNGLSGSILISPHNIYLDAKVTNVIW